MANKNHALDGRIIGAARREFLDFGYEKASLRRIAAEAGVTVGAIYTRYPTKDALFCSLVQPLIEEVQRAFGSIRQSYYGMGAAPGPEEMAQSMQQESEAILHLLFDHYDRAVLLLCRSRGSSLEHFFDVLVERKTEETLAFFRQAGAAQMDEKLVRLLIDGQFHMYFRIISEGCQLDEARRLMHAAMAYHTGGWLTLLRQGEGEEAL